MGQLQRAAAALHSARLLSGCPCAGPSRQHPITSARPAAPAAGAYPASLDDAETQRILTTLLELGVNTFVCLQAEFSLHTPDAAWRSGQGLRPYIKDAQQILIRARETRSQRIMQVGAGARACACSLALLSHLPEGAFPSSTRLDSSPRLSASWKD